MIPLQKDGTCESDVSIQNCREIAVSGKSGTIHYQALASQEQHVLLVGI